MDKKKKINMSMNNFLTKKSHYCLHSSSCGGCEKAAWDFPPIGRKIKNYFYHKNISFSFFHRENRGWRLRAKLAVREEKKRRVVGLFGKKSHRVVEIPHCIAHHPLINEALFVLEREFTRRNISGYCEKEKKGDLRYIQMTVNTALQKVELVLVLHNSSLKEKMENFAKDLFRKSSLWLSIWINFQPLDTNTIFGKKWHHIVGEKFLFCKMNKEKIAFHPAAFFQAHMSLFEKMIESIKTHLAPCQQLVEFYAGVGVIGKSLQAKAKKIFLVEVNPFAQEAFKASITEEEKDLFCYFCNDVDVYSHLCHEAETILVDPPRKGLSKKLLEELCRKKEGHLVYVSCNFSSFQRDLEQLLQHKWQIEKAEGYLFFPRSNHVETLTFLKKQSG